VVDEAGLKLVHDWIASLPPKDESKTTPLPESPSLSTPGSALRSISQQSVTKSLIDTGLAHEDPLIRDLFERFLPEEQRVKRLGTAVHAADILALKGDVSRGRELFAKASGVQCRNCHRVGEEGKAFGPDLTQIGKKLDRAKLLESILEPSKTIDPQFVTQLLETTDGRVISGLLVKRTVLATTIKTADGKEVTVPNREIEQAVTQQQSLMPDLLLREMTAAQVADLLEYMSSLK
jgi:putative heme-binding domain-containing protein